MTTVGTENSTTAVDGAQSKSADERLRQLGEETASRVGGETVARLSSIRWGRTVNIGNYESVRLDAEAVVYMDGEAESTLRWLERWVDEHLPLPEGEHERILAESRRVKAELADLRHQRDRAVEVMDNIKAYFEANGLDLPNPPSEDLPF